MDADKTNILYSNIKDIVSATTNVTLREKESDAEQPTPHATFTRVVGVLFIVPIERNEEGNKVIPIDSELYA